MKSWTLQEMASHHWFLYFLIYSKTFCLAMRPPTQSWASLSKPSYDLCISPKTTMGVWAWKRCAPTENTWKHWHVWARGGRPIRKVEIWTPRFIPFLPDSRSLSGFACFPRLHWAHNYWWQNLSCSPFFHAQPFILFIFRSPVCSTSIPVGVI